MTVRLCRGCPARVTTVHKKYSLKISTKLLFEVRSFGVLEHKSGNISETRKDREKVTMEKFPTPYGLPFSKIGVRNPTPKLQSL